MLESSNSRLQLLSPLRQILDLLKQASQQPDTGAPPSAPHPAAAPIRQRHNCGLPAHHSSLTPIPAPPGALERISHLPVPCHTHMDWAERDPDQFVDKLVGPIGSIFGRLVVLGCLLDRTRSLYVVQLADSHCQCPMISEVLGAAHRDLFIDWLSMSLERKVRDLVLYLDDLPAQRLANAAIAAGGAINLAPLSISQAQLDDLLTDAELCLALSHTYAR